MQNDTIMQINTKVCYLFICVCVCVYIYIYIYIMQYIYLNITNGFIATFDQFIASLLNENVNVFLFSI